MIDLSGARAKYSRASELFGLLDAEALRARLATGREDDLFILRVEGIEERPEILTVTVAAMPEYPVARWAVLIGDILHNLRSSLDHCAYQLVLSGADPSPLHLNESQFPLCDSLDAFGSAAPRRLAGVSDRCLSIVRLNQPFQYNDLRLSPLHHLRELSNRDKHRLLTPVVFAPEHIPPESLDITGATLKSVQQAPHLPLAIGRPLLVLHVVPKRDESPQVQLKEGLPLYLSLGDPAGLASVWLTSMLGNVERLIEDLGGA